ncbi:hypothetical protein [Roseibium sp.]|uniref:hypothetical protein n=1 Tax=Roseibium sp. TaxID=1936156 RepID=UPI003A97A149
MISRFSKSPNSIRTALAGAAGVAVVLVSVQSVEAQSRRPLSTSMTCAQVQSMIKQRGAVVMSTGPHTFDRYVANGNYCRRGEFLRSADVPTRDQRRCYVERCESSSPLFFD